MNIIIMHKLNPQQKKAVEHTKGSMIIVAGAGTGKTTVITQKISHLIEKKLALPEEILSLVFNDKAAEEIQERVDELVNVGYAEMYISTFHSFCQRILERYALDIGLPSSFKLLSQTDAWILIRKNLSEFNLEYYSPLGNPTKHIHELIRHFSKCKDELVDPEEYLEYAENIKLDKDNEEEKSRLSEIANAYHVYNKILLDNDSLDFGDLIYYTVKLLKKRPNILKELQKQFKFILVDEFQDVNWAQYQLVKLLANNNITVVGDDDQSIYSFRGASVSNILQFKDEFKNAVEVVLNENYRSGQNILDKAYESVQNNNPDRLETKLKIDKKLKSMIKDKGSVIHAHKNTLDEEVKFVIDEISSIKKKNKNVVWDDFAILVRANNHASPFLSAFESAGIPYEFLASSGLYRQPIVLDCINFFNLLDNYHESSAIFRLLRLPFLEFKENDIQKITYSAKRASISYYEALKKAGGFGVSVEGIEICQKIVDLIHVGMKESRHERPHRILYNFLEKSGYLEYLAHQEGRGNREVIRQIYQLTQFFEYLKKYEENIADAKITDFMEQFNYLIQSGEQGSMYQPTDTPDSVNIVTVHKAKGLEFKYVFVVNLVEDRFPTRRRGQGIELPLDLVKEQLPEGDSHTQEERRLFYVATTRAKERLYLTSAFNYGGQRSKKISKFLDEIGYKVEDKNKKDKKLKDISIKKGENAEEIKRIYKIPNYFSHSQIKSYNTCPYQYKLSSIIKLPMKQSHYFSFGNTIHNTLQKFYEKVRILNSVTQESIFSITAPSKKEEKAGKDNGLKVPELDELLNIYDNQWIGNWYQSKKQREKYYDDGKKMLKQYYEENSKNWTIPVALEKGFKIPFKDFIVSGRIDRIDQQEDGTLHIVDYKTGKSKEKPTGEDKEQLIIYQIATSTLPEYNNIGKTGKLTLYFVKDGIQASFLATDKEIEKIKIKIINTVEKIRSCNFKATPSQFICQNCNFKDICEFKM